MEKAAVADGALQERAGLKMVDETGVGPRVAAWRPYLLVAGVVVLLFLLVFGWRSVRGGNGGYGAPPPTDVAAVEVLAEAVPQRLRAVGTLVAVQEVVLTTEEPGRVETIRFREGQSVPAGALLVALNADPEKADLRAAKAHANFAKLQLDRARKLIGSGAESKEILEQRLAEKESADAAVAQIEARIGDMTIHAPFAGVVGLREINLGQYVRPGDPAATLTDLGHIYADFTLPQQDLSRVKPGAVVEVTADTWPERVFRGKVVSIEPQVSRETRNIRVRAELPNGDHALRPGMYVETALVLPDEEAALTLPLTAIVTTASGDSAIVIRGENPKAGGKAAPVEVTIGRRIGTRAVVGHGLRAGDVVVSEGQLRVQPGADVRVVTLDGKPVATGAPAEAQD